MFGNNSFSALATDNSSSAGPSSQIIEGDEVDVSWLKLIKRNGGVDVKVADKINLNGLPDQCNLMTVMNRWGLLVIGGNDDVRIHRLADVHRMINEAPSGAKALPEATPAQILPLPARPVWVRSAMNDERLVVATANGSGVFVWNMRDAMAGNSSPLHSFTSNIPNHILDVLPNPAVDQLGRLVALIANEGLVMADIDDGKLLPPVVGPFTCASWSAKGKQIVVGKPTGELVQYTPEGTSKSEIASPPELDSHPSFVQWLENDLFLVTYAQNTSNSAADPIEQFIIHRQKGSFNYIKFFDPLNGMGFPGRSEEYRHYAGLGAWGSESKHLAFILSGAAADIAVMNGRVASGTEPPAWEVLFLDGAERGILPTANTKTGRENTCPLGLAFDFTSTDTVPQSTDGTLPDLAPVPRLLTYSQEGVIISFDVRNPEAGAYPGMICPQDITSVGSGPSSISMGTGGAPSAPASTPIPTLATPTPLAFGSASGSTAFGQSAFGAPKPGAFGGSAFGASTKPAAFGASASFGQTSAPGQASASPTPPSAFSQASFGSAAKPANSGAASPSAFGVASKPAFTGFGQSSQSSGFGQPSAFGQPAKSAFGASPSAFGQSAFAPSKPASPAPSATSSAFGVSAFGQGKSTPSPAFGASTTTSAFGGSGGSKSTFGATGFGFGQNAAEVEKKEASAFGGGGAFGSGVSMGQTADSGSAFNAGGGFGFSGFGHKPSQTPSTSGTAAVEATKPLFMGFGSTKSDASSRPSPSPSVAPTDDFGLGGFASALETSKPAGVPGLDDSPPASPVIGSRKPAGLEDDSPPSSPPPKASTNKPFGLSSTSSMSSAFKPATAFGNMAPGNTDTTFGFGQTALKKTGATAFGSGFVPATPTTPGATVPAPATAASFGKPSALGATGVAFGQSSKLAPPTFGGFGTPSKSTAATGAAGTTGFGNISGGFGGFAAKAEAAKGFGGFSTGVGKSAFGNRDEIDSTSPFNTKAASPFGVSSGATPFGAKPAMSEPKSSSSPVEEPKELKKDEEVKGYDVPEPSFSNVKEPQTPLKDDPTTTPSQIPIKAKDDTSATGTTYVDAVKSTIPEQAPDLSPITPMDDAVKLDEDSQGKVSSYVDAVKATIPEQAPDLSPVAPLELDQATKTGTGEKAEKDEKGDRDVEQSEVEPVEEKSVEVQPVDEAPVEEQPVDEEEKPIEEEPVQEKPADEEPDTAEEEDAPVNEESEPVQEESLVEETTNEEPVEGGASVLDPLEDQGDWEDDDVEEEEEQYPAESEDQYEEEDEEDYEDEEDEEDYEVEEDEEEPEDEDGSEDEEIYRPRRRSTSVPPDMSPIDEESSDNLEESEDESEEERAREEGINSSQPSSNLKSPPVWFSKSATSTTSSDPEPSSPTPTSAGATLLSRLSTSPTSTPEHIQLPDPPKQPFSFKHASKTSSPLSGPPLGESTTPESSPAKSTFAGFGQQKSTEGPVAKPVSIYFGSFGQKSAESAPTEKKAPSPAGFSLSGKPVVTTLVETATPSPSAFAGFGQKLADVPKTSAPFSLFGQKADEPVKSSLFSAQSSGSPVSVPSAFSAPVTAKTVPEMPKPSFGLGLGRPSAPSTPSSTPPSFFSKPVERHVEKPQPSLFTQPQSAKAISPPEPQTPATESPDVSSAPPKPKVADFSNLEAPRRSVVPERYVKVPSGEKSMASVTTRIVEDLSEEIQQLKKTLAASGQYHKELSSRNAGTLDLKTLLLLVDKKGVLPFAHFAKTQFLINELHERVTKQRETDTLAETKMAELRSKILRMDMKIGQVEKLVNARTGGVDVQQVDLTPEQAAAQAKLRKGIQATESRLEELESLIAGLRRRTQRAELGRSSSVPPLERIQRQVRGIDAGIRDRQQTIEELSRRIASIRTATPSRGGVNNSLLGYNTTPSGNIMNFEPTKEVIAQVEAAIAGTSDKMKKRLAKLKVARLNQPVVVRGFGEGGRPARFTHESLADGPIMIDQAPFPGCLP